MINRNQVIIVYCTVVAFAILYEHQTLLPILAQQWDRSLSDVALITTVTMLPLALAPLVYGYFLERLSSRHMLIGGFVLLLITQAFLSAAPSYGVFIVLRGLEGLLLPAIFTALMTYSSALGGQHNTRRNISFYIAATIVGGYCGRLITGFVTDLTDWQTAFWMWSFLCLVAVASLFRLDSDPRGALVKISAAEIKTLVGRPVNQVGLLSAFLLFFVTAAMMNFLPFRMVELNPEISTGMMSLVYTGYLVGAVIAVFSTRIVGLFGSEKKTLFLASLLYLFGCSLFLIEEVPVYYLAMVILMSGMFTIHSVLSAYLNHLEAKRKGIINGLYVSSYYSGGVLGSYFPGLIYQSFGWLAFCSLLIALLMVLVSLTRRMPD